MQFVVVTFPTPRTVWVDGMPVGQTDELLSLAEGIHNFDLGKPADYGPAVQQVWIAHTSPSNPRRIAFKPLPVPPGSEQGPTRRKKKRLKAVKKTASRNTAQQKTTVARP